MRECAEDRTRCSGTIDRDYQGRIQGGGGRRARAPLSESLVRSIDFYSGFRKKSRYTLLYSGFREKKQGGGAIPNPKKIQV